MKLTLPALSAPLAKARQWFQEQSLSDQQRLRWLAGFLTLSSVAWCQNPVLTFRDRAAEPWPRLRVISLGSTATTAPWRQLWLSVSKQGPRAMPP